MKLVAEILQPLLAIVLAPLLLGVINRVKAFFAGRHGQPFVQPYYDLWRLLHKGAVYSRSTSWVFRLSPPACLAALLTLTLIVPLGGRSTLLGFEGDLVLAAYLLALVRFFLVAAALDTASSFEGMGASREAFFSALTEPALFVALAAMARLSGRLSLPEMFAAVTPGNWATHGAALLLVAATLAIVLLAENSRIPVDDPNTHLELTMIHEVMVLDNSGPDFAFIQYGSALKLWLLSAVLVGAALPIGGLSTPLAMAAAVGGVFLVAVCVGTVESCMARLRMTHVPLLLFTAVALAVLALVFSLRG